MKLSKLTTALIAAASIATISNVADACSRFTADTDHGFVQVRTLDWSNTLQADLQIRIPGEKRQSLATPEYKKSASWTVKHRTMNFVETGDFEGTTGEAVNEEGLSVSVLYMGGTEANYSLVKDNGAPAVNLHEVASYITETYATTQSVIDGLENKEFQVAWNSSIHAADSAAAGALHGLHFSVQDKNGHIILVQVDVDGQVIYDTAKGDNDITVMTNDPTQRIHRKEMAKYDFNNPSSIDNIGSGIGPVERNLRLTKYLGDQKLSGLSEAETQGKLAGVMETAAVVPFDVIDPITKMSYQTAYKIQYTLGGEEVHFKNFTTNSDIRFSWSEVKNFTKPMHADLMQQATDHNVKVRFTAMN